MEETYIGIVVWFNNQYGFIAWAKNGKPQKDMFVHYSDIICEGFKTLKKDQKVSFSIGKNNGGADKACNVTVVHE